MLTLKKKIYNPISCEYFPEKKSIKISGIFGESFVTVPAVFYLKSNKLYFYSKNKGFFEQFKREFRLAILGVSCGWYLTMELIGRGFSVSLQKNFLIFNVGFSHGFVFFLSKKFQCYVEQKKKTKFLLLCNSYHELKNLSMEIKRIKPLNIYKGSGIRFENEVIKLKTGKQTGN